MVPAATQMTDFHSASKLLQDIQIEYTCALDLTILRPVQVRSQQNPAPRVLTPNPAVPEPPFLLATSLLSDRHISHEYLFIVTSFEPHHCVSQLKPASEGV